MYRAVKTECLQSRDPVPALWGSKQQVWPLSLQEPHTPFLSLPHTPTPTPTPTPTRSHIPEGNTPSVQKGKDASFFQVLYLYFNLHSGKLILFSVQF